VTQFLRQQYSSRIRRRAHPSQIDVDSHLRLVLFSLLERQNYAIGAYGKANSLCSSRPTEQLDQSVVTPAAANRVLGAQTFRGNFKGRSHVVVEPTHKTPIFLILDSPQTKLSFQFGVMLSASVAKMLGDPRQFFDNRLLFRQLGIEHTQRIRL